MAELLFQRDFAVTVGAFRIAARPGGVLAELGVTESLPTLRVQFKVEKTLARDPNTADVLIYNLSEQSRKAFSVEERAPVVLEAGYVGNMHKIFSGNLSLAGHSRTGSEWVTKFQAGDGLTSLRAARVSESFAAGTSVQDVVKKVVGTMGLGLGNTARKMADGDFRGGLTEFTKGFAAAGQSHDVLDGLARSLGLEWHVQDGQVEFMRDGEPADDQVVVLSPSTGLVGSPEIGDKGMVKARSLLQPGVSVGRLVQIKSALIDGGFFRVDKATHVGDTWGAEWYTEVEARPRG